MFHAGTRALVAVVTWCVVSGVGAQHEEGNAGHKFDTESAYRLSQAAIGGSLSNHSFVDRNGRSVTLTELVDRPTVVSMIYTSCYEGCPTLTRHLEDVVEVARQAMGPDSFNVISVGFDTASDTPRRMALFAAERGIDQPRWYFLSTDESTLAALAEELGFTYRAAPHGFDHITQTTLIDAKRSVTNQIYGVRFEPPLLVEPLKYLLRGQVLEMNPLEGWWREIKLLCTVYDPSSGRYHFDYSLIVAMIIGAGCLIAVGVFVVRSWRYTSRSEI